MQQLLKDSKFKLQLFCECKYNIEIQLDLSELRFANFHLEGKCSLAPLRDIRLMFFFEGSKFHRIHGSWTLGYSSAQDTRELDLWVLFRTRHTGVGPLGTLPFRTPRVGPQGTLPLRTPFSSPRSKAPDELIFSPRGRDPVDFLLFSPPSRSRAPVEMFLFSFLPAEAKPLSKCICFLFFPPGQSP